MTGSKEWFCEQVRACESSLYRVTVSLLSNRHDAEDAMQEAICSAFEKLPTLKDEALFRPWFLKIAVNACYDILRRRKRIVPLDDLPLPTEDKTEERLTLWMAVQALPADYRSLVVLFYYEDCNIAQISQITGISESTVKTRLFRARQRLKVLLAETEVSYETV